METYCLLQDGRTYGDSLGTIVKELAKYISGKEALGDLFFWWTSLEPHEVTWTLRKIVQIAYDKCIWPLKEI